MQSVAFGIMGGAHSIHDWAFFQKIKIRKSCGKRHIFTLKANRRYHLLNATMVLFFIQR